MLNGDDNENGSKTNRISKKKQQICTCSTLFVFPSCRFFGRLQRWFVRLKRQTS